MLKLRVDDPLDAVAVHLCGGLWGVVATPIFARENGIIYNGSKTAFMVRNTLLTLKFTSEETSILFFRHLQSLGWNLVGAAAIVTWSAVLSTLMFGTLSGMKILRVSAEVEIKVSFSIFFSYTCKSIFLQISMGSTVFKDAHLVINGRVWIFLNTRSQRTRQMPMGMDGALHVLLTAHHLNKNQSKIWLR